MCTSWLATIFLVYNFWIARVEKSASTKGKLKAHARSAQYTRNELTKSAAALFIIQSTGRRIKALGFNYCCISPMKVNQQKSCRAHIRESHAAAGVALAHIHIKNRNLLLAGRRRSNQSPGFLCTFACILCITCAKRETHRESESLSLSPARSLAHKNVTTLKEALGGSPLACLRAECMRAIRSALDIK